jgi:ribonuclease HI
MANFSAEKAAFMAVPETCRIVDDKHAEVEDALSIYQQAERDARDKLRAGLIGAYEEVGKLEDDLATANTRIEELDVELDHARDRIKELEADLQHNQQIEVQAATTSDTIQTGGTNDFIEGWFNAACEPVNPGGHIGWGCLLKLDGQPVWSMSGYVPASPETSNNVGEYTAALKLLREIGRRQRADLRGPVIMRGDSKLVIMQLKRKWKVHGGLYVPIYQQAVAALAVVSGLAGGCVQLEWIGRDFNGECDVLSKSELHRRGVVFRLQPEAPPREEARA